MSPVNLAMVREWRDAALAVLQEVDAPPFVAALAARVLVLANALLGEP